MVETANNMPSRRPWLKRLLIFFGALAALLIIAYLVVTSSAFFKSVILPRVANAMNADIEVGAAEISPFSQVVLRDLRVQTTGEVPLLTAELLRVRYSLLDILRGNINVDEFTLEGPVVRVIEQPDGSSNLDPLFEGGEEDSEDEPGDDEPLRMQIQNVSLKNGLIRKVQHQEGGQTNVMELRDVNIALNQLGNNTEGKLEIAAGLSMLQTQPGTNDFMRGTMSGAYTIALNEELLPVSLNGSGRFLVQEGLGAYQELAQVEATLEADMTPTEIRNIALRFTKEGELLGVNRISGPFNWETKEAHLIIVQDSIGRSMLNLAAAGTQWDFQDSTLNATNEIQVSRNGNFIAINGQVAGRQLSVSQQEMATPPVNLNAAYALTVDLVKESAVLQRFHAAGEQNGQPFLRVNLDEQMNISWGGAAQGFREASLRMVLTNFNLAEWRAVIGTNVQSGRVNLRMGLVARQDGQLLEITADGKAADLAARFGTNQINDADMAFSAAGSIQNLAVVNFPEYSFSLSLEGRQAASGTGALRMNLNNEETSAQISAEAALPVLVQSGFLPQIEASAGAARISVTYSTSAQKRQAVGALRIENFTGKFAGYDFEDYRVALDYNVGVEGDSVEIRRASASFSQAFQQGGTLDLTGNYDMESGAGRLEFKAVGLNQNTFRPFIEPYLAENQLVSISINSSGTATLNPEGESAIQAEVNVRDWVMRDASGNAAEPLSAAMNLDGALTDELLNLRQLRVKLAPTERASNELLVEARIGLAEENPAPGTLALRSQALDVTPYYNMFAGKAEAETAPADAEAAPAGAPAAEQEPEPMDLPFQRFTADLDFDRFYLRDLAISNWTAEVSIISNVVTIDPFQMQLNGGGVNFGGSFDVGVPGYRYQVAFATEAVPLEPLANAFSGTNEQDRLQGLLFTEGRLSGQGTTGRNLKEHLEGNLSLNLTNMNYQVVSPKVKRVLVPIANALRVPELAQTPINWISTRTDMGGGRVAIESLQVQSEAFFAESSGFIELAEVLTNSPLHLPLHLALRRSLAVKSRLVAPENAPDEAKYVELPTFVTVEGTLGAPDPDIDYLAVAGMIAGTARNLGLGNEETEELLGDLSSFLTGHGGTNAPGTNQPTAASLLRGLGGLLDGGEGGTNAAPAEGSITNEPSAAGNLLQGLRGLLDGGNDAPAQGTNAPVSTNSQERANPFDFLRGLGGEE